MTEQILITTIDTRGVARLTMNRPEVRNAFNEEMIHQICDAMGQLSANESVRAIILTGAGAAFSGGADLNMMARVAEYSASQNRDDAHRLAHMLVSIYSSPKPTIALVNGPAMGGGVGLIAACDIAIAQDDAFFALSEVKVGLIPAVISPFVIEAIGMRKARRYFVSGERFNADDALAMGLLHELAPQDGLDAALNAVLKNLLSCGPAAQGEAKALIHAVGARPISEKIMKDTASRIARLRASKEGKEGVRAFLEKRKPSWIDET